MCGWRGEDGCLGGLGCVKMGLDIVRCGRGRGEEGGSLGRVKVVGEQTGL
jgi:hypothetical protein